MNKDENKERIAFFTRGDKKLIEELAKQLEDKFGIKSNLGFSFGHVLYVKEEDYQRTIADGSIIAQIYNLLEIEWVDADYVPQLIGYIPIMYGVLPQNQDGSEFWSIFNKPNNECPEDFKNYIKDLKNYCGTRDIILKYNRADNAFNIFIKGTFASHKLMSEKCKCFNNKIESTPFANVYYPESDNSITINSEKVIEQRTDILKSYFEHSLFHDIIRSPEGANIAPHNDDYPLNMGIYGGDTYLSVKSTEELSEDKLIFKGEFKTNDKKGRKNITDDYCIVTDSGDFTSELSLDENQVSMTTTVNVSRTVEGTDLDGQNRRDNFFTCLSDEDSNGTVTYTEHFVKIADGTRLLHYSDEYDYFEIFDLPNNWLIENGLSLETIGYPKVFDDVTYDLDDKDLAEVYELLSNRKKELVFKK